MAFMPSYNFKEIEQKWQKYWATNHTFQASEKSKKPKYYALVEFPYPSGDGLHVGHPRPYTGLDVVARKKRAEGFEVLYPFGWDAFGLPTENYAIKTGVHPSIVTKKNTDNFRRQTQSIGFSFDWSREVNTTDPSYYKWTQWIFLQLFKHGLAYKAKMPINWCPKDKIGLANEEVVNGCCERCGTAVEKREKEQWMLAITKYADRLIDDLGTVDYVEQIKTQQKNWIGRSEGAEVVFKLRKIAGQDDDKHSLTIFTTRPDTMFGATFVAISPELGKKWLEVGWQATPAVRAYIEKACAKRAKTREQEEEKTGIDTGVVAVNPVNGEEIPVWVANYVMGDVGTGAIMAVPAHDERDWEFATTTIPTQSGISSTEFIRHVVEPKSYKDLIPYHPFFYEVTPGKKYEDLEDEEAKNDFEKLKEDKFCFPGFGVSVNSGFLTMLPTAEAKEKMISWLEEKKIGRRKVQYKLRDWVFSRQRYWGEPIPLVWCAKCNEWVPIPEKELPVVLPNVEKYQPTDNGESPLAPLKDWVNTKCPKCGGPATRETDTMPNWAGSSWYFLRYADPHNKKVFASPEALKHWLPIDWYNGGMEHTTLHLLYSRFWHKFLWDIGAIPKEVGSEPYKKRTSHGLILAKGGVKMSKSKGNVVNPDEIVGEFGADVFRTYEMFMGPFDQAAEWDTQGLAGVKRFLERVWGLQEKVKKNAETLPELTTKLHKTIKKVTDAIDNMRFNTGVAALMEFSHVLNDAPAISADVMKIFVQLLAPYAPHMAEEVWSELGHKESIATAPWPKYNSELAQDAEMIIVIQVNGKLRDQLTVAPDTAEEEIKSQALASEKIQKWLEGKAPKKIVYVKGKLVSIVV